MLETTKQRLMDKHINPHMIGGASHVPVDLYGRLLDFKEGSGLDAHYPLSIWCCFLYPGGARLMQSILTEKHPWLAADEVVYTMDEPIEVAVGSDSMLEKKRADRLQTYLDAELKKLPGDWVIDPQTGTTFNLSTIHPDIAANIHLADVGQNGFGLTRTEQAARSSFINETNRRLKEADSSAGQWAF